jgi:hypothetical protein
MLYNFFVHNLQIFGINLSFCPWQAFQAYSNKHTSLVQKFVNYRQKSFITYAQVSHTIRKIWIRTHVSTADQGSV